MKLGIEEINGKIYCANCKKNVATNGNLPENFCSSCGAPLTIQAIEQYENDINVAKRDIVIELSHLGKKNNTDSLKEVLIKYLDSID